MAPRSTTSSTPILVAIILILTFPVWVAIGGALFGVIMGLFGVMIGLIGAIFGGMVALIALPFKLIFGWGDWGGHWFPHFHFNGFLLVVIIIVAALIVRGRRTA